MQEIQNGLSLRSVMRYVAVILLFVSMLLQSFSRYLIIADYEINKDYIAKNLCENRDKPWMNCCGKCQMMKKLKQEDKKDQSNPNRKAGSNDEVYPFRSFVEFVFNFPINNSTSFFYIAPKPLDRAISVFHPPQFV